MLYLGVSMFLMLSSRYTQRWKCCCCCCCSCSCCMLSKSCQEIMVCNGVACTTSAPMYYSTSTPTST
uniref:Secreted protein n=1 Tax=Physcomitrium patens TaxID=3218 RepID=A0A2K1KNC7_PHYPA|nr:hypothetical protein PHYPA_006178 [Physcomitrium patens]